MKLISLLLLFVPLAYGADEFVGPFPSWINVGGIGNDGIAIQQAINSISPTATVVYIPSGTYSVSQTLTIAHSIGISLICQDPTTTILKWTGPSGGTILNVNGVAYSRFDRCTFDGGGTAGRLVDQSWDGTGNYFDTGNEYADDVFTDGSISSTVGINGGGLGFGFAETVVKRCKFLSLQYGILLGNFNALDLWVWDSLFDSNFTGISNFPGAGNWHVYNSVFRNSVNTDNHIGNTGGFSFVGNYSVGSGAFIGAEGNCAPAQITIQKNQINSTDTPVWGSPISIGPQGPLLILDNQIGNPSAREGVNAWNWCGLADAVSVGNKFAQTVGNVVQGRLTSVDDLVMQALTFVEPTLPTTPVNMGRMVFEVPSGSGSSVIQNAINAAVAVGNHAVVHLPAGTYNNISIVVPSSNIQIIGDSQFGTRVNGRIILKGPSSHVVIREMWVIGDNTGDGIAVEQSGQQGSRLLLDQMLMGGSSIGVLDVGLINLNIDIRNTSYLANNSAVSLSSGVSTVNVFSAASGGGGLQYLTSSGKLMIRDEWHDSGVSDFLHASGSANVSVVGSHIAANAGMEANLLLNNFTGVGAFISTSLDSQQMLSINGTGQAIAAGIVGSANGFFSGPIGSTAMINSKQLDGTGGAFLVPGQGTYSDTLLRTTLAQIRKVVPSRIMDLPSGATDVQLYRVQVSNFGNGIHPMRKKTARATTR